MTRRTYTDAQVERYITRAQDHLARMTRNGWEYDAGMWEAVLKFDIQREDAKEIVATCRAILNERADRRTGDY